ncbi:MAG: DUF4861 family protein [Phycisphaerae bacterium]
MIAQDARQQAFERVFGDAVRLDPAIVARVKALKPGEPLRIDADGDGRNDEYWFIDPSPRHTDKARPILVRVIDEDGDLDAYQGPDLDSDLYVADWKADGSVDAVIDYTDTDGDHDVDEMAMYYWSPKDHFLGRDALRCWWGRDDGDDNLLWYDVNYTYDQALCQWRSHFSGDETFVAFGLTAEADHWVSIWENPFLFYDPDADGCSEVVVRFSGLADRVEALRYSFDADDNAAGRRTHDYDFSITAIAPNSRFTRGDNRAGSDLRIPADLTRGLTLRGIPTGGWLQREHAQKFARQAAWARALLTWDEIHSNTAEDFRREPQERWEGVINHASRNFPQVGGPPTSAFNKRNEVATNPASPLKLYYHPADRRLHLKGASEGWLDVDSDFDGRLDARYTWLDEDGDGYFDRRRFDSDGDGAIDSDEPLAPADRRDVELDWKTIAAFCRQYPIETIAVQERRLQASVQGTATAQDWVPPNIGWESERVAYRAYWGQFDFFGKSKDVLIYPTIGAQSYHDETDWGIDALLVGKTSGIGGLTLYHEGQPYRVQNPAGEGGVKFEKREVAKGPVRAVVEIAAAHIIPERSDVAVRMTCIIHAGHQETEIRAQVTGLEGETLLAPGFMKLDRERHFIEPQEGFFGSWGFQSHVIGDIGMGLVFDPKSFREMKDLPDERRIVLSTSNGGNLRYWIIGDWRRGRQYPIAPTVENWRRELRDLAGLLLNESTVTIERPEEPGNGN